jgi:hypothetical protein
MMYSTGMQNLNSKHLVFWDTLLLFFCTVLNIRYFKLKFCIFIEYIVTYI